MAEAEEPVSEEYSSLKEILEEIASCLSKVEIPAPLEYTPKTADNEVLIKNNIQEELEKAMRFFWVTNKIEKKIKNKGNAINFLSPNDYKNFIRAKNLLLRKRDLEHSIQELVTDSAKLREELSAPVDCIKKQIQQIG